MKATIFRGYRAGYPVWGVIPEGSKHPVYVCNTMMEVRNFVKTYGYEVTNWKNVRGGAKREEL